MLSYWAYILIGNDSTGKTSFQRYLVSELGNQQYTRLPRNLLTDITHPQMLRGIATLSTMNRSYQEKKSEYRNVAGFFRNYFQEADICVLSSHTNGTAIDDIREMIRQLRLRAYNVAAVFFSNGFDSDAEQISLLDWDERLWLNNPEVSSPAEVRPQIEQLARDFVRLLIARAATQ